MATKFKSLPGRVFLDTSVINLWLDFGDSIHDAAPLHSDVPDRVAADVEALRKIALTGSRAQWQLAVSPLTYLEIAATGLPQKANELTSWFWEIWTYWREFLSTDLELPSFSEAETIRLHILSSTGVCDLVDQNDRVLLTDAVVYGCELFCTSDWSTILRHRDKLTDYPIPIVTPVGWWNRIQPWAAIWV